VSVSASVFDFHDDFVAVPTFLPDQPQDHQAKIAVREKPAEF
jgi:hypothetical protein